MPKVRRYGTQQVESAPIPGVRKTAAETPTSTGAGLEAARAEKFETIAGVGSAVGRQGTALFLQLREAERDRADDAAILEASNKLARVEQGLLYSDGGALSKKGKDSFGLPETVNTEFEKQAGEIAKGLVGPKQQAAFARERAQRGINLSATLHRHVFGERQAWEASELKEGVKNGVNAAVANALDPRRVAEELQAITTRIERHGPRAGMSPEAVKAALEGATTDVHVGVVERLLANNQDRAAKAYFEETKAQISGTALERVEKAIEVGSLRGEAQRKTEEITRAGGTFAEQLERAKAIDDPELQDEVRRRLEHQKTVDDRIERERRETDLGDAYVAIDRGGSVDAVSPALWARVVRDGHGSALRAYAKQRASGAEPETNYAVYYGYLQMASNEPANFVKTNLLGNRHQLSDSEFKQLASLQMSIRSGQKEAADKVLDDFRSAEDVINNSLRLAGVDPTDKKATAPVTYLRQRVGELSGALARETGKKPTNKDIQAIVDSVLSQPVSARDGFWSYFSSEPNAKIPLLEMTIGNVPTAARRQIEDVLRKNGRPINDAAILDLYIRGESLRK